MKTEDALLKLNTIEGLVYDIQDNLGSDNNAAITAFAAFEELFSELQDYFDELENQ